MKLGFSLLFFLHSVLFVSAQFSVSGGLGEPYEYNQNLTGTGIEKIYLLNTLSGAVINYTTNATIVRFYKYSTSASDKELIPASDISSTQSGNSTTYTIKNITDSKGYFAEINGGISSIIWIIDYSKHLPGLNSIHFVEENDRCEYLKLLVNKTDDLFFYANNGGQHRVKRLYDIEYDTETWDSSAKKFNKEKTEIKSVEMSTEWVVDAPLTDTQFKLSGDQFAKHFGMDFHIMTSVYSAVAVQAYIEAIRIDPNAENGETTELDGSAPAEIHFKGHGNDPVANFYTWHIYKTTDMDNAIVRYTDQDIKFIFKDAGQYIVKLQVEDRTSFCSDTTSIQFFIEDFELERPPNILVLNGTHKFKIKYKSIIKFKCTIFNRWGNKIYEWRDPNEGWDGRHNGREVTPGVYFYVIEAEGPGGKKHVKSGDINVLKPK